MANFGPLWLVLFVYILYICTINQTIKKKYNDEKDEIICTTYYVWYILVLC